MKACIITVGDEILIGQIIDTNSPYIAQKLNEIGIDVEEIISISDEHSTIVNTLHELSSKFDLIITTGGLGPTKDDVTKKAIAEFLGKNLILDKEVLKFVEDLFAKKLKRKMNDLNREQALKPEDSEILFNPLGTAPGLWSEKNNMVIINLPGVPFEMKYLIRNEVIPTIQERFKLPFILHKTMMVSGIPESELALKLETWEDALPSNIKLAYLPDRGNIRLRLSGRGEDKQGLTEELEEETKKLIPILGESLNLDFEKSVEETIGKLLIHNKMTIATAESCTGGNIAKMLTSVSGSSKYFKGSIISYATKIKEEILEIPKSIIDEKSVVSEEVAKLMAKNVCKKLGANIAVSTTGVAGPSKGEDGKEIGTVWIGISDGQNTEAYNYNFPELERNDFIKHVSALALYKAIKFIKK